MLCTKKKYRNWALATRAVIENEKKYGIKFAAYICHQCCSIHLTSHTKSHSKFLKLNG